ncbi:MAG: DUF3141 domain-containing protein [Betaproteobacteria bacterium]|nr:MAG: DUF3141 domain-containing protein [Betaproteobacteria bacterium]
MMFSDVNPLMNVIKSWADLARANRKPMSKDNYLLAQERRASEQIEHALTAYGHSRDDAIVRWVEFVYGPMGLGALFPPDEPAEVAARARATADVTKARRQIVPLIHAGGFPEALARILIGTVRARGKLERRSDHIGQRIRSYLKEHRKEIGPLIGAEPIDWPAVLRAQTRIVMLEPEQAIEAIPALIPKQAQRELAVVIAAKMLMLEPELGDADSRAARRVYEVLGVDFNAAAEKLGVATPNRTQTRTGRAA